MNKFISVFITSFLLANSINVQARFLQADTYQGKLQEPISLHKYLYANGNPVNNVDPSGNYSISSIGAALSVVSTLSTSKVFASPIPLDFNLDNATKNGLTNRQKGSLVVLALSSQSTQKQLLLLSKKANSSTNIAAVGKGTTIHRNKLNGLTANFRPKAEQVLDELNNKGYDLRIVWGKRTKQENDALVKQGKASKNSKHLTGEALDFINRIVGYDNANYPVYTADVGIAAKNAQVIWGGNFTTPWDPNHIENP